MFVSNIVSIRSRCTSITANVKLRALASTNSGNHSRTRTPQSSRLIVRSPGTNPSASAFATYLRTVPRSTPKLAPTSALGRPACQCCKISTTSITSNVLLAINPSLASKTSQDLHGQGTELRDPQAPSTTTPEPVEYVNVTARDYVNADPSARWIT